VFRITHSLDLIIRSAFKVNAESHFDMYMSYGWGTHCNDLVTRPSD